MGKCFALLQNVLFTISSSEILLHQRFKIFIFRLVVAMHYNVTSNLATAMPCCQETGNHKVQHLLYTQLGVPPA